MFFYFLIFSTVFYGSNYKSAEYNIENIVFKVSVEDRSYIIKDTIDLMYDVENNSDKKILIFNPRCYLGPNNMMLWMPGYNQDYLSWDKTSCSFMQELGGNWLLNLGFRSYLDLIIIEPGEKYNTKIKLLLSYINLDDCYSPIILYYGAQGGVKISVLFNDAFIFYDDDIKFDYERNKPYWEFGQGIDNGGKFEVNLKRFLLGPIMFEVKK